MTGVASRNSALQISEIRVSCTKPTKLRVLVSVKTALTKDKATLLHEAKSKAEERELAIHINPSSIDDSSRLLVLEVYRRHHWHRSDEQLLKKEFSFEAFLQYCSGQSESRVYEIFRKDGIIVSAELKARNELENTDSSAPELPDNSTTVTTVESDVATNAKGSIDIPSHSSELTKIGAVHGSSKNDTVISNLLAALEIVQQVGKIVESAPFIEPIGAILSEVVKVYKEVKDNHGKRDALLDKVASLALDIGKAILRLKDSGHAGSISRLQSDLEEYTGLLKEARELIGAFDDRGGFIRIVKRGELGAGLDSLDRGLDFSEQDSGSTVIEELFMRRGNNTAIAYFYFDFSDDSKQNMEIALCRLVLQLSRPDGSDWAELLDLLQKLLQQLGRTYLILDALDECGNYDIIATFVQKSLLGRSTLASSKMLKAWESKSATIISRIIQKSNGMFRLAYCLLQELERCKKPAELDATLDALPNTLHDTYARWLGPEMLPAQYLPDVKKLLHWMIYSARPLTVAELEDTIAFDFSNPARYIFDPVRRTFRGAFMEWMSGLVSVNHPESKNILDADHVLRGDCIVSLAHSSVQDYLLLPLEKHPAGCNACPIHVRETVAHPLMAETCIDYLLHFADPTHPLNVDTFPDYPLASYAAECWGHHLVLCDESARLFASAMHLMKRGSAQHLAWNHLCTLTLIARTLWWSNSLSTPPVFTCSRIGYFAGVKDLLENHEVDTEERADALRAATHNGHTDIVRLLLVNGANNWEKYQALEVGNALSIACREGHTEIVHLLIASGFKDVSASALQAACQNGHTEIVRLLITNDANVEMPEGGPLVAACGKGHIDIVRLLLEKGANVNPKVDKSTPIPSEGSTPIPLQAASSRGHIEIVHLLLDKGADVDTIHENTYGYSTALSAASYHGHIGIVRLLLERGARDKQALEAACTRGNLDIARLVFEHQAEHNIDSLHDALQAACDNGHMDIMHFLLGKSAVIAGGIELRGVSGGGYTEIVRFLLEKGGDINYDGSLTAASYGGHFDIVHLLLDKGADVNPDPDYGNPLEAASETGHTEIVRILLEKGVKINAMALQVASRNGHIQIVRLLLENGADVKEVGKRGGISKTSLSAASDEGHSEIVRLLLENGAHVNEASIDWSALFAASKNGHIEIVRLLLENGAHVNHVNEEASIFSGTSALFAASCHGHIEIVRLLLKRGADINAPNGEYGTALRAASQQWYMDIVRLLLENGAREEDKNVATQL
ncbi:ankyrin repeat-containing domain protein [Mycena leptocephala]|nr:ankyrin repeat-containing domain protein [Mycena leptocephala]